MNKLSRKVSVIAAQCHSRKELAVVVGTGPQREKALAEIAGICKEAVYIHAGSDQSERDFLFDFCKRLTGSSPRSLSEALSRVKQLALRGKFFLVISNAESLSLKVLETIRSIFDVGNVGIMLGVSKDMFGRISQADSEYRQMSSRISGCVYLGKA
jgi:DNA transposition AAA+ family ATPase